MTVADRKQREKEQRKNEIVNAAEKLFYAKGFDRVTMDEIADTVELSKGSLYVCFKNKDSLFFAIVDKQRRHFVDLLEEHLKTLTSGREKLRAIIREYVDFAKADPEFSDMASTYAPLLWSRMDSEDKAVLAKNLSRYHDLLNNAIHEGMEDGTIRDDLDPMLLSYYITLICMSVVYPLPPWKKTFAHAGISLDQFLDNFSRFIDPSIDGCPQKNTEKAGNRTKPRKPGKGRQ